MRRLHLLVCVLVALLGVPALGFGQWLRYPTADVPTKPDGKPDLTAPAPRLPDGKPDLSGLWHAGNRNIDGRPLPVDPTPGCNGSRRAMGGRHARGADSGLPRQPVDRHQWQPDERVAKMTEGCAGRIAARWKSS